jgi:hypothetical protein
MGTVEDVAREWLGWFNEGAPGDGSRFYAPSVQLHRLGVHPRLTGRDAVVRFLRQERQEHPGLRLECLDMLATDSAVAIEAECSGFPPEHQRFDSPSLRLGPTLVFLAIPDGLITQDHTYVAAAPQRIAPVGLDEVTWAPSGGPMPALLEQWERLYLADADAMMTECYTADATVTAMRIGSRPVPREEQIAIEQRSAAAFPGRRITVKRWLAEPDRIAVEITWEGRHHRDPTRSLRTVSGCYLRLRDGRIAVDHTYIPTGLA